MLTDGCLIYPPIDKLSQFPLSTVGWRTILICKFDFAAIVTRLSGAYSRGVDTLGDLGEIPLPGAIFWELLGETGESPPGEEKKLLGF